MSRYRNTATVGTIRSRLLVNAFVDPDEAQRRLPRGLRPHTTEFGTVVGCCLLDLVDVRPACTRALPGVRLQAAAHRISVELGNGDIAVWVPARLTKSRMARTLGGRCFPGVHRAASTVLVDDGDHIAWTVRPHSIDDFGVHVKARVVGAPMEACDRPAAVCVAATVGFSTNHRGVMESAVMTPSHRAAADVDIDDLTSNFIDSFATARPAPSYLMRDVEVMWR